MDENLAKAMRILGGIMHQINQHKLIDTNIKEFVEFIQVRLILIQLARIRAQRRRD
jgi:hypothetical protein